MSSRFAVLLPEYEQLSYNIGKIELKEEQKMSSGNEVFYLNKADSEQHAQLSLVSSEFLANHAREPVGYVCSEEKEFYFVSKAFGIESRAFLGRWDYGLSSAIIRRLADLHTQGLGCGGIKPEDVEFLGKEAKLRNPGKVFALYDQESAYYEAVATFASLAKHGFAGKEELAALLSEYLSYSPVCRHEILEHQKKKGRGKAIDAFVENAIKMSYYF